MPNEILVFDAAGSNIDGTDPGSPLLVGPGTVFRLREFKIASPPTSIQYAGSVDTEGSRPASRKHENFQITLTITCDTAAGLRALQTKAAKIYREGGTLKWNLPNAEIGIYDLYVTDTFEPTIDPVYQRNAGALCTVNLSFTCAPYARGAEVDLGDNVETTLPWLVFTEATVAGDMPALGRLVIDNDEAATSQRWVVWGIQQHYYSAASTAALFYEAESCAMISPAAAAVGPAGASGGGSNVAKNTALTATQDGQVYVGASATAQTHIGTFRVFTRVYLPSSNTGTVTVGLSWAPFKAGTVIANDSVAITTDPLAPGGGPIENQWVLVDLGTVSLPKAKKGTQGWIGYVTASSTVAGDDINIDWISLVPVDEGYGEAHSLDSSANAMVGSSGGISAEIRYDDALVQDSSGSYWVKPEIYEGDYLLVPPSGAEARTLRAVTRYGKHVPINASGYPDLDITLYADVNADVSARLFVTPRYLVVPSP